MAGLHVVRATRRRGKGLFLPQEGDGATVSPRRGDAPAGLANPGLALPAVRGLLQHTLDSCYFLKALSCTAEPEWGQAASGDPGPGAVGVGV